MTVDHRTRAAVQPTPTTLSSLVRSGQTQRRPRWSRRRIALNLAAVVVGSALGATLALRSGSAGSPPARSSSEEATEWGRSLGVAAPGVPPSRSPAPGREAAAVPEARPPAPAASPAAPAAPSDLRAALVAQVVAALSHFIAWSHDHPGARCPDAAALGVAELDPWGHPLRIVCADQPADQIAGVLSFGPDGVPGTRDDIASWALGAEVTDLVRGPRWASNRRATVRPAAPPTATSSGKPPGNPRAGSNDTDGEGIPNRR